MEDSGLRLNVTIDYMELVAEERIHNTSNFIVPWQSLNGGGVGGADGEVEGGEDVAPSECPHLRAEFCPQSSCYTSCAISTDR